MWPVRQTVIRKDHSIATSSTEVFDIKLDDIISRLTIIPKITNPNAYVAQGHPDECLPKIQIVDGSNVLVDGSAIQLKPVAFYGSKRQPVSAMNYMALQWSFSPIEIYFGRYLFDPKYGLNPAMFRNLQIKVQHDLDAAMANTSTGYIDIVADVMNKDMFQPEGLLTTKVLQQHTITQSGVEYSDLPEDLPIRQLVGVCFSDTQAPEYQVEKFELYAGQKSDLLIEYDMEDYQSIMQGIFGEWIEKIYGQLLTTDRNLWITPSFERVAVLSDYSEANSVPTPESTGGQKLIASAEATVNVEGIVRGHAPHGSCPYIFPHLDDEQFYTSFSDKGGGTLKLTFASGADTTPTYDIMVQQLMK